MTALKPLESHDVKAVSDHDEERKLLRRAVLNRVCAHPECDDAQVEGHHLFPRSFISNSSWFVRIPEVDKPILHVAGLCRKHHADVEEHRAWIKLEDETFNWYRKTSGFPQITSISFDSIKGTHGTWDLVGPLVPQPGEVGAPPKKRARKQGAEKRARRVFSISVPKDELEDGAGILDDLIATGRELWGPEIGWKENVPPYFVICAAFAKAFQS